MENKIVPVKQVMNSATPSPTASTPCNSGSSSSVPTGALVAENADEQVQPQQRPSHLMESYVGPLSEKPELDEVTEEFNGVPMELPRQSPVRQTIERNLP